MDGCFDFRSRLQLSQCSQPTPSRLLADAFNHVTLNSQQDVALSQDQQNFLPLSQDVVGPCSQLGSQEMLLGTQDFITPADQQVEATYDPNNFDSNKVRSPVQLSPRSKRRRQVPDYGSESLSQCSQDTNILEPCSSMRPPQSKPSKSRLLRARLQSPPCHGNPFLKGVEDTPFGDVTNKLPRGPPPSSRYRNDFKELGVLGHGNFSKVFRVVHRLDGREYAVKRSIKPVITEAARSQWLQEMQALAAVDGHSNIVRYYTGWVETIADGGEHLYIQLEKCDVSLGTKLAVQQPFTEDELIDILQQMCQALHHLHSLGVAHMDLKADNIYTTADGTYKLGDFGLATLMSGVTTMATDEGDARYLSQELLQGDYSRLDKADMFALGATLYELAMGVPLPSGGQSYQDIRQGKLRLLPTIDVSFQNMLKRLMSANPEDRPSAKKVLTSALLSSRNGTQQPAVSHASQGFGQVPLQGSVSHSQVQQQGNPPVGTQHGSHGHAYGMLNFKPV